MHSLKKKQVKTGQKIYVLRSKGQGYSERRLGILKETVYLSYYASVIKYMS